MVRTNIVLFLLQICIKTSEVFYEGILDHFEMG